MSDAGFRAQAQPLLDGIPPAPRSPSPRAKDLVLSYRGSQQAMLLAGGIVALVGTILFFALGGITVGGDLLLAITAEQATGTVVDVSTIENVKINGRRPKRIRYRYAVAGATYEDESSTTDLGWASQLQAGAPLPIEISSVAPSLSRATGTTRATMGYLSLLFVLMPIIGWALLLRAIRSNGREVRAFLHGRPVEARVVSHGPDTSVKVNGRHPQKLVWRFEIAGRSYEGSITSMDRAAFGDLLDDGRVAVLYDPASPKTNTIWVP